MQKTSGARGAWFICAGILLAFLGVGLMGFRIGHLLFLFLLFLGILLFIRKGQPPTSNFRENPAFRGEGIYLGSFDLNGCSFEAYECASNKNGIQLRLTSFPAITHEQEAAFIRYIVNEGLAENIWPGMGKKIAAEANWAFLE